MDNAHLAQEWVRRADEAGIMIFVRGGEVWIGSAQLGQSLRVDRFREALNADPDGKAALLATLNPMAGEIG